MKLLKLYILIVLIGLIFGVGNSFTHKLEDFNLDRVSYEEVKEKKEEIKSEKSTSGVRKEDVPTEGKQSNNETITSNNNVKPNNSIPDNKKQNEKKNVQANSSKSNNDEKEESGVVDSNGNNQPVEKNYVVDKTPWEKAGVSEYDWYHKPVHTWMRVDYSVHTCGSVSNCEALCMNDAEELAYTENVSCIQVYTYSGSYLGEMLKRD